jgi:hypothetical protein
MDIPNNGKNMMVGQNNKIEQSKVFNQTSSSTSSDNYECSPKSLGCISTSAKRYKGFGY